MLQILAVATLLGGCADSSSRAEQAPPASAAQAPLPCGPGLNLPATNSVATLNGVAIPCSELLARDGKVVNAIKEKYERKLREIHLVTLAELIDDRLLLAEAKKEKLSVEKFVSSAVAAVPASEADVKTFYEQAIAAGEKLPPFEETKADIASFLTERRQKEALSKFRADLRGKAKIEMHLPAMSIPKPKGQDASADTASATALPNRTPDPAKAAQKAAAQPTPAR